MKKDALWVVLLICIFLAVGCGSADEETAANQEPAEIESSLSDTSDQVEASSESDEIEDDSDYDNDIYHHYKGDREVQKDTWDGHTWSRPISYNEMLEIYEEYYEEYLDLDESLDDDAFVEADEQLCKAIAEKNDITYNDFQSMFGAIGFDDMNRIQEKCRCLHE